MPTGSIKLTPGVDTIKTPALNEAGISASNLIRFRNGIAEKLGGWSRFYTNPFSSPPRALWPWEDLENVSHLAVGTATSLSVITNGVLTDITPQNLTTNGPSFSTTSGSSVVTVADTALSTTVYDFVDLVSPVSVGGLRLSGFYPVTPTGATTYTIQASANATSTTTTAYNPSFTTTSGQFAVAVTLPSHGYSVGQTVAFVPPTSVGGLVISGFYTVQSVASSSVFTINAPTLATGSATASINSGNTQAVYWLTRTPGSGALGFGLGGFGLGGYGTGAVQSVRPGANITTTSWTLDNYGELLVACPTGGPVFQWGPANGFLSATLNASAPSVNTGMLVADAQEMIVAYGSSTFGQQDPLLVRWCDAGNPTVWTASSGNQAGSYRLPTGSRIVSGLVTASGILLWTDVDLWLMNYVGYPNVWGFNKIASGCGLIAQKAVAPLGNTVFWMSQGQFWAYQGTASPIPCSVYDSVFSVLDRTNVNKICAGSNSPYDEVRWFFPTVSGSGENDTYVCFSSTQQVWDTGSMPRSAWTDQSIFGSPIGASVSGYIYQHEVSPNADAGALTPSITTGYFMLSDSEDFVYVDLIHPDIKFGSSGTVNVTLYGLDEATDTAAVYGPYLITPMTKQINLNVRARMLAMQFSSNDLGSVWRLGNTRFRYQSAGRR